MIGAIIGDIVGSRFEFNNKKSKEFELFPEYFIHYTDDTVMTLAVATALLVHKKKGGDLGRLTASIMRDFGRKYPGAGYGKTFNLWLKDSTLGPYNSWGNGAAMRVSACGWMGETLEEVLDYAERVTVITHNHPEGIKGAKATAHAIYLARTGATKYEIEKAMYEYYYIDFYLDEIRDKYSFTESSQGTLPYALECFFESTSFEDCLRNCISIGGDSDTIAAIACSIAEAYYGVPYELNLEARKRLDRFLNECLDKIEEEYPSKFLEG